MSAPTEVGLDLRVREPDGEPRGALVLNHGRATDENDLFGLLDALDPERRLLGVTTGAPFRGLMPGGRHWYIVERIGFPHRETFERSLDLLGAGLDAVLEDHGIAWGDAVLGGFSQGAVMSYALGLAPGRPSPKALVALSGFVPTVAGWEPALADRAGLPVYIHHGVNDPIIGVEYGRAARDLLEPSPVSLTYRESVAAHGIPVEVVDDLRSWLA